jgi:hypothetical protein
MARAALNIYAVREDTLIAMWECVSVRLDGLRTGLGDARTIHALLVSAEVQVVKKDIVARP